MSEQVCPQFKVKVNGDPATDFEKVVEAAKKNKLTITGDAKKGTLKHTKFKVTGKYTVSGKTITFNMKEDEWFDQCPTVEKEIRKALKGQ